MEEYIAGSDPTDAASTPSDTGADNDGIPNYVEGGQDPDGDGLPNWKDPDSDGDGIGDAEEAGDDPLNPRDSDGDGIADYLDLDSDGDTIADETEASAPEGTDPDSDEIPNWLDLDSDGDGFSDEDEAAAGTNPYDAASQPMPLTRGWLLALVMMAASLIVFRFRLAQMEGFKVHL
jgi:hypothetical protein